MGTEEWNSRLVELGDVGPRRLGGWPMARDLRNRLLAALALSADRLEATPPGPVQRTGTLP